MIYKTSIEENNKILMTDIQEDLNKWKDIFRNQKTWYHKDVNFTQTTL